MLVVFAQVCAIAPAPVVSEEKAPRVEALVLDVEGISGAELDDALAPRLPGRPRMPAGNPKARQKFGLYGYVSIRGSGSEWTLTLILSDGRLYRRTLSDELDQLPRAVATTLANLLDGIEAETVTPDEVGKAVPDTVDTPVEPPPPKKKPEPRPEIGLRLGGGVVLGVGPPPPTGLSAGGGAIGLSFRAVKGAYARLGFRGGGRTVSGFALARFRISALGGYALRKGKFEMVIAGGLAVEPFFVQRGGQREPLARDGDTEKRSALLLGGFARLAPGFRTPIRNTTVAFALAPVIEIGGSAIPSGDGGVARIRTLEAGNRDLFRAGGLELFGGLEFGFWFSVPK